jgi:alpha-tubulin suppressor-like RCC1 family protein
MLGIAAGQMHTCAVDREGRVYCWGSPDMAGSTDRSRTIAPTRVLLVKNARRIAAGPSQNCAALVDDSLWCWGKLTPPWRGEPTHLVRRIEPIHGAVEVAVGSSFGCALLVDGRVTCWGNGGTGGHEGWARSPRALPAARQIAVSATEACALLRDGRVVCWPEVYDQLARRRGVWKEIGALRNVTRIALGAGSVCGHSASAATRCVHVSDSVEAAPDVPEELRAPGMIDRLALERDHGCCITRERKISCWGVGSSGEIGRADKDESTAPTLVAW